jgi:hypothetical protein
VPLNFISSDVHDDQRVRIKHDNVFDALCQIELRTNLEILCFVPFAYHFNYRLGKKLDRLFVVFVGFATETEMSGRFSEPSGKLM